jgi:hypothetical protein
MSNESMIYVPIVYKDKISNNSIIWRRGENIN